MNEEQQKTESLKIGSVSWSPDYKSKQIPPLWAKYMEKKMDNQMWSPGEKMEVKALNQKIKKPWGHETILTKTDNYVVKEIYVRPNSRLSLQYHEKKIETMILISGQGYLLRDVRRYGAPIDEPMKHFKPYHITPNIIHRLYTKGEACVVVEISTTELEVIRLLDDYGRT